MRGPTSVLPLQPNKPLSSKQSLKIPKKKEYPWDSHQDDIVVNSTELNTAGRKSGIDHYRHQLTLRKTYEHITTDFAEDMEKFIPRDALPVPCSSSPLSSDGETKKENDDGDMEHVKHKIWDGKARLPKPKFNRLDYDWPVYCARTTNPAVFLAIIRIAEKNLAFINFESAVTHLPNRAVNASLPVLPFNSAPNRKWKGKEKAVFTDDLLYEKKKDDQLMTVLFLPEFYKDGKHAVGYYDIAPGRDKSMRLEAENVVQLLFTPCDTEDLVRWGLVHWVYDAGSIDEAGTLDDAAKKALEEAGKECSRSKGTEEVGIEDQGEEPDAELMEYVGARDGKWLNFGTVEDYDEWAEGFRVVRRIWERMIKGVVTSVQEGEMKAQ
ncbi:hypothetical protein AA0113_g7813 [Alternaria arborescens]|uniref:Uncharacterized protein n=1 Tax=Alternaria arborescens TaxID=156630 RepID=A0A4Q4RMX3_9PLEO|nr:hypothetical protein AA0113_g7813 [Alternaria arborescens]